MSAATMTGTGGAIPGQDPALNQLEGARGHMAAVARGILGPCDDVEDVVQEALVRAYMHLPALHNRENLLAWIRTVTRTVCLNMLRRRRAPSVEPEWASLEPDRCADVEGLVVGREALRELMRLLAALPPHYAEPLRLYCIAGCSYRMIAHALGVPLGTVKGRIHRGRRMLLEGAGADRLRELLGEEGVGRRAA